jgi:hypothetical protein
MASVVRTDKAGASYLHVWNLTTADPIGDSISHPGASDRTIQFIADTTGSATIVFEGSLDDVIFFNLTDGQGNAISFTASGGELVSENVLFYRPQLSVVGSGAVWTVKLLSRSTMR